MPALTHSTPSLIHFGKLGIVNWSGILNFATCTLLIVIVLLNSPCNFSFFGMLSLIMVSLLIFSLSRGERKVETMLKIATWLSSLLSVESSPVGHADLFFVVTDEKRRPRYAPRSILNEFVSNKRKGAINWFPSTSSNHKTRKTFWTDNFLI